MATKSILKNITIKSKTVGQSFVNALEKAKSSNGKIVTFSKSVKELKHEDISKLFGENKWQGTI